VTAGDLDVIAIGSIMAEISPPEHSVRVTEAESLVMVQAGSATTFALAFARLGGRLGFISRVGPDEIGAWIRQSLDQEGIDTSEVKSVTGQTTPVSLASVDETGRKTFIYYRFPGFSEPLATLKAEDVSDGFLARGRVFDLTESVLRSAESRSVALELAKRARRLGASICINPNYRPTAWTDGAGRAASVLGEALQIADLAVMNAQEAALISGEVDLDRASRWLQEFGPPLSVITRGEMPALVLVDGRIEQVPALDVQVVYDIGAGDTFHAAFLADWTRGADPVESARFATQAAALKIQRPPLIDQLPTRAEVEAALAGG
jgi:sugar/nucleoside kinase (ribokinase family)